jgi:SAM-dependent methyltransferase
MLSTQTDIREAYRGSKTARGYIAERFESELTRLLHERQVEAVNALVTSTRPRRVLEIAPGPGRLTRNIRSPGTLVCLEYNEGMIEHGRPACDGKTVWVRGDGFHLPFRQVFDVVYCFRFVRHFHRANREQSYAEIRRVLKPGGYFIMDAVNERISRPLREEHPENYPIYDKLYLADDLTEELSAAGLATVGLVPVQKYYRWQHRSQVLLGPRANWANRLAIRSLERVSRAEGLEWIVTCRRG